MNQRKDVTHQVKMVKQSMKIGLKSPDPNNTEDIIKVRHNGKGIKKYVVCVIRDGNCLP